MASTAQSGQDGSARAVALTAEAERLRAAGDHRRAAGAARRAVSLFEKHEGRRHPDVAAALLELGQALEMGDRWAVGLRCYQRASNLLEDYARLRDPDIRRLRVKAWRALCVVERVLGQYAISDRHGRRAADRAERWFGARDLDLAGALNDIGMLRKYQGRYSEAPRFYRRALRILAANGLAASGDAASIYHNLGGIEHARLRTAPPPGGGGRRGTRRD